MQGVRERIQPKFAVLGERLAAELSMSSGEEMYLHIAKHARRTVNPPSDTWLAVAPNKRGYKQHPHFQFGLWDDRVFAWFALIYELPDKQRMAETILSREREVRSLIPGSYRISLDHTVKDAVPIDSLLEEQWLAALERFRDVKSCELLLGQVWHRDDPLLRDGTRLEAEVVDTFNQLMPIYRMIR